MYSSKIYVIKKIINKNYVILIILHRDKSNYSVSYTHLTLPTNREV